MTTALHHIGSTIARAFGTYLYVMAYAGFLLAITGAFITLGHERFVIMFDNLWHTLVNMPDLLASLI